MSMKQFIIDKWLWKEYCNECNNKLLLLYEIKMKRSRDKLSQFERVKELRDSWLSWRKIWTLEKISYEKARKIYIENS